MNSNARKVEELSDGNRTFEEIAEIVGMSASGVKKIVSKYDFPRRRRGAFCGEKNHQFVAGRRIDLDGYVLISVPKNHPFARQRTNRPQKLMFEHRRVMEIQLGRYLHPEEVVDHIDGLTLHNHPSNLRAFGSNGEHLAATISGTPRNWTESGLRNIGARTDLGQEIVPVDIYHQRRKRGDARLRQILLAALKLGIDSPFLSGTHHHLKKVGIDPLFRSSLERGLAELTLRYDADHAR